jgi:hypothetical protein
VRHAFLHFLRHESRGGPLLLAGHSQGSYHLIRLLEELFVDPALRERLVAAYAIGVPVPLSWLGEKLAHVPLCGDARQTGCLVTWNAVAPDVNARQIRAAARTLFGAEPPYACVNPLTWRTDGELAPRELNLGGVAIAREISHPGVPRPGIADARCHGGLLQVSVVTDREFRRGRGLRGDYHLLDYALYYVNLGENARARIEARARPSTQSVA